MKWLIIIYSIKLQIQQQKQLLEFGVRSQAYIMTKTKKWGSIYAMPNLCTSTTHTWNLITTCAWFSACFTKNCSYLANLAIFESWILMMAKQYIQCARAHNNNTNMLYLICYMYILWSSVWPIHRFILWSIPVNIKAV